MKLTAEIQIYNDEDRAGHVVRIHGTSNSYSGCGLVDLDMNGLIYQVNAKEVIEALHRVSGEFAA